MGSRDRVGQSGDADGCNHQDRWAAQARRRIKSCPCLLNADTPTHVALVAEARVVAIERDLATDADVVTLSPGVSLLVRYLQISPKRTCNRSFQLMKMRIHPANQFEIAEGHDTTTGPLGHHLETPGHNEHRYRSAGPVR